MFNWPELELTNFERLFVRPYKCVDDETDINGNIVYDPQTKKPRQKRYEGVLPRIYHKILSSQALTDQNIPTIKTSEQIQLSRRARVFAIAFGGNVDRWGMNIQTSAGTQYTQKMPRSQRDGLVSAMIPGSLYNVFSNGGDSATIWPRQDVEYIGPGIFQDNEVLIPLSQPFPMLIEPNWLLMPNETLIFNGTPYEVEIDQGEGTATPPVILHIYAYVWEFPGMTSGGMSP